MKFFQEDHTGDPCQASDQDVGRQLRILVSDEEEDHHHECRPRRKAQPRENDLEDDDECDDGEPVYAKNDDLLTLQKRKLKAEIVKKELEIATIEGKMIDERIIASLIGELGQGIRLNFVDACLRQSEQLCSLLGVLGREREVQEYLEVDNGRRLEEVKRNITKIMHAMKRKVRNEQRLDEEVDHE